MGHYIKDCPLDKVKYKEYVKKFGEREENKDQVPHKCSKRVKDDRVVK